MKDRLILAGLNILWFIVMIIIVAIMLVFFWTTPIIWIFTGIWWTWELWDYASCKIDYKINEYEQRVLRK